MKTSKEFSLLAAAGVFLLSAGISAPAISAPVFEVTPSAIGSASDPFESTFVSGQASTLVTLDDAGIQTGIGVIDFGSFSNPTGGSWTAGQIGLGVDWYLWATYEFTAEVVSGVFGQPGSVSDILTLEYTIWAAPEQATFTNASVDPNVVASVIDPAGTEAIGGGSLLSGVGGAAINAQGGSAFNSVATYENTAFGNTFFTAPVPFYNVSFNEFNNTAQGVVISQDGRAIAINQASGGIDFNTMEVPEPGVMALFGLGLIGLAMAVRRKPHLGARLGQC
ncbi:flocculation-associated PEP-CTERM protein PepA [Ectothiorhodospira haloalkaliphila]|uniref:flocculation-associated PEP-CTERM protein PepA n=1 Tax=Ectothiorhodospira haloalkaliphila TaxID=421628 RepID=UPI001EE7C222|nr:flocculation-associated PEP-CTERM protein PepA [Ectothiorhodospira haloalkaliphila]MCG5524441.1 flocculation-associated PEP-CTERM protein PepA [Ectothiorhodospira haloalkaliphila]